MARKKALSNQKIAAVVRKRVEELRKKYSNQFKIGDFVKEKYIKDNVALVLQEAEAVRRIKYSSIGDFIGLKVTDEAQIAVDYLAHKFYNFKIKVLWMQHPELTSGDRDQISDMSVHYLTPYKEKKVKKVLESPKDL